MNDQYIKDLAKKAMQKTVALAIEKAKHPKPPPPKENPAFWSEEETTEKSEDALDRKAFRKGGFSKAEKRAYAKERFAEELIQPPKNPPPAWLSDPSMLPKKPPTKQE